MPVRVGDVEVSLAPFCVAGGRLGVQPLGDGAAVEGVHVGHMEDGPPPPRPSPVGRLGRQVEVASAGAKAGECGIGATVDHVEAEGPVETHSSPHVVGSESDGADGFDHRFPLVGHAPG